MNQRTKPNNLIVSLVSQFEHNYSNGNLEFISEKNLTELIHYYESELMYRKAIEVINIAIQQYNYNADFLVAKARIHLKMADFSQAFHYLEKAEKIAPFDTDIQILKAKVLASTEESDQALSIIEDLKLSCSNWELVEVYLCEAFIHETLHDFDSMYFSLTHALRKDTKNEEALERIWLAVELSKRYIDSIRLHDQLLNKNPYSHLAWFNLGHAYACIGEYEHAIDALEYSFIVDHEFNNGYMDCADICMQISKYKKALEVFLEAEKIFGFDEELSLKIAECQYLLDDTSSAKVNLLKSIKMDPYSDEAYHILAKCYAKEEKWNHAIKAFHKAIAIDDGIEEYYLGIGQAYHQLGSFDKAEQLLKVATQIAPEESQYWTGYLSFLIKTRQIEKALDVIENEAADATFGADILYCQFVALHLTGSFDHAVKVLEEALMEDIDQHSLIFELEPELKLNKQINSIINYYMIELMDTE